MNGEENSQISIPEQLIDNLPMPDNLDYTDLNDYEQTEYYELFNAQKIILKLSQRLILILIKNRRYNGFG